MSTPPSILIVDDLMANVQTLVKYLEEAQETYELLSALNGTMALRIAEKHKPNLVITDWEMPEMSGLDLIMALHNKGLSDRVPCMVVTGLRTTAEHLKQAFDHGAVDFLRKPLNKVELWARVDSVLKLQAMQQNLNDQKNRELSIKALQVYEKNQFLHQVEQRLVTFLDKLSPELRSEGRAILKDVSSQKQNDHEWAGFKLHFESVHPNFFRFLQNEDFKLTKNDLRWCAYIRIGLTTRDIANLLNVDYAGARVNKTRIKKKLNLTAEDDLTTFLMNI